MLKFIFIFSHFLLSLIYNFNQNIFDQNLMILFSSVHSFEIASNTKPYLIYFHHPIILLLTLHTHFISTILLRMISCFMTCYVIGVWQSCIGFFKHSEPLNLFGSFSFAANHLACSDIK